MTVLAQLSDPHIEVGPDDIGSSEALAAAVAAVMRLEPGPDAVLVSGDITNQADARAYERARELLAPLAAPVHVLPGNHDDREALRTWFTDDPVPDARGGRFQYALMCGALRLVVCDTTQPGREDGRLDAGAIAWLEARLAEAPDTPTIVAMHHPPLLTGIGGLDAIGLPEGDRQELGSLLSRSGQVRRVVAGHVHRGAFGVLGGCGVFACPSVFQQARLELRPEAQIALAPGGAALGVHVLLAGGEVVSHVVAVE